MASVRVGTAWMECRATGTKFPIRCASEAEAARWGRKIGADVYFWRGGR